MLYYQLIQFGCNGVICELKDIIEYLQDSNLGEIWQIKVIDLTEEEYKNLPESMGF